MQTTIFFQIAYYVLKEIVHGSRATNSQYFDKADCSNCEQKQRLANLAGTAWYMTLSSDDRAAAVSESRELLFAFVTEVDADAFSATGKKITKINSVPSLQTVTMKHVQMKYVTSTATNNH